MKHEGIELAGEEINETHDMHTSNVLQRPKAIYNFYDEILHREDQKKCDVKAC